MNVLVNEGLNGLFCLFVKSKNGKKNIYIRDNKKNLETYGINEDSVIYANLTYVL